MNKITYMILCALISIYCSCNSGPLLDNFANEYKIQRMRHDSLMQLISNTAEFKMLDSAYYYKDLAKKNEFIRLWSIETDSTSNRVDTTAEHYYDIKNIFDDIYQPDTSTYEEHLAKESKAIVTDSSKIEKEDLANFIRNTTGFPRSASYIVIQGTIDYTIYGESFFIKMLSTNIMANAVSPLYKNKFKDIIPSINYYNKKMLICNEKYSLILDSYFSGKYGICKYDSENSILSQSRQKRYFLMPELQFSTQHWEFGSWHYITFPEIFNISFNEAYTQAKVEFRSSWNSGGNATYMKENGVWKRQEYDPFIWIE